MWEETIMFFPTQMILLRSGTGGKSLSNTARAGLASPALHTNALNDLLFPTWRNYQNAGLNVTSFSLIPLFSPALLYPYSASCCPSPACHGTYSPRPSQAAGDPQTREQLWLLQHQNSHPSCPKPGALPVAPGQSDTPGKDRQDGHPANIHLARSEFPPPLEKNIQLFLSLVWYKDQALPPCC